MRDFEAKVYQEAEKIAQKYPEVAEIFETKTTDIVQLRNNIPQGTLVIQPVILRDKVAIFVVTQKQIKVIPSDIKSAEINQLISQYRKQLADYKNSDYYVTSSKLYNSLIRPVEAEIKANSPQNVAIIATEKLRYIPFETLYDKKTDQYLLEKYPISYLTRISNYRSSNNINFQSSKNIIPLVIIATVIIIGVVCIVFIRKFRIVLGTILIVIVGGMTFFLIAKPQIGSALVLANPKPTQQELKGTEIEAETISKIFPNSEKDIGTNATLETFKNRASLFSILHLGTHGCFSLNGCRNLDMKPNTILFANNQQYNIADAALLGLKNTELIILSACETAKEANSNGQEISGLAYVLERAGSKSVIASLWSAEDTTSAEIMGQFYQNLKDGMTKSEAMRQAKINQIKRHPFFWSPFILIGDAN